MNARRWAVVVLATLLFALSTAAALGQAGPLNDLFALGQGTGESPAAVPIERREEPPLVATPRADCGPGSHTEPDVQGRVPAGTGKDGFNCNAQLVGHQGTEGGFKTLRYNDSQGRECAFYD